jgi:hypothetical protein
MSQLEMNDGFRAFNVAEAAKYLDGVEPGWFERIDFSTLRMMDGDKCIAGQLGLNWATCGVTSQPRRLMQPGRPRSVQQTSASRQARGSIAAPTSMRYWPPKSAFERWRVAAMS